MVRIILILALVAGVGLIDLPPLLSEKKGREIVAVSALLVLSLVSGLMIVVMPEGATVAKLMEYWLLPLGEALMGPM